MFQLGYLFRLQVQVPFPEPPSKLPKTLHQHLKESETLAIELENLSVLRSAEVSPSTDEFHEDANLEANRVIDVHEMSPSRLDIDPPNHLASWSQTLQPPAMVVALSLLHGNVPQCFPVHKH